MPIEGTVTTGTNFWLNFGAEQVYNSIQTGRDAAKNLQTAIQWVFGVYTATGIMALVFAKPQDWNIWSLLIFGVAFAWLILAYWQATLATFIVPSSFYSSAEASVRQALTDATARFKKKFGLSVFFSAVGVSLYALALALQFSSPAIQKGLGKKARDNNFIAIHAKLVDSKNQIYAFQIQSSMLSWFEVYLIRDSTVKGETAHDTLSLSTNGSGKSTWLYSDSAGIALFKVKAVPKSNCKLVVSKTDTTHNGSLITTNTSYFKIN